MLKDSIDADEQDTYLIDYLFDLNGYIILKNAIGVDDLAAMNQWVDDHWEYVEGKRRSVGEEAGAWIGHVETHTYSDADGCNFQNIIEGGAVFRNHLSGLDRALPPLDQSDERTLHP